MGAPSRTLRIGDDDLLVYDLPEKSGQTFSLKLLTYLDVSLAPASTCHAVFRMLGGRVAEVRYPGDTSSMWGTYSVCAPLVEECERGRR